MTYYILLGHREDSCGTDGRSKIDYSIKWLSYLEIRIVWMQSLFLALPGGEMQKAGEDKRKPYSISLTEDYADTVTETSLWLSF